MSNANLMRLLLLSAVWGSSFMFMRIAAPVLAPIVLACSRFIFAAVFLAVVMLLWRRRLDLRANWHHYAIQGALGAAIPFNLFSFAAQTLPASLLSVLNATAPIWAALLGVMLRHHRITLTSALGLILGMTGVAILVGFDPAMLVSGAGLAVLAATIATMCYSVNAIYMAKLRALDPLAMAFGCMMMSTLFTLPIAPFYLPEAWPAPGVIAAVAVLGIVCSGMAYLVYFRLMAEAGTTSALTVTFLVPVFGILWGALFLDERIGWNTLIGSVIVITGTALVAGFRPRWTLPKNKTVTP